MYKPPKNLLYSLLFIVFLYFKEMSSTLEEQHACIIIFQRRTMWWLAIVCSVSPLSSRFTRNHNIELLSAFCSRLLWSQLELAGCRMGRTGNYVPRKPQNSDRFVYHLLSYRNDFIGKKFTVHEVGYREESDMLMSDVRGSTISHYWLL